jgi:hypothetical protein
MKVATKKLEAMDKEKARGYVRKMAHYMIKFVVHLSLAMIAVLLWYQYMVWNDVWIDHTTSNGVKIRLLLPDDVAASKDCNQFDQWQKMCDLNEPCPWARDKK